MDDLHVICYPYVVPEKSSIQSDFVTCYTPSSTNIFIKADCCSPTLLSSLESILLNLGLNNALDAWKMLDERRKMVL